ncbi:F-box/kelch-repeat protein [Camellia lanceoleosa]|uniref:F-box/kelch-repeat protein n=1 Tax=Camellia lanceoleosa TaxID=1840588 RepID=A0ACC0HC12_9ERIC|nr:F-box/kelch-repeat protein [Camellia lanceoleosa]
MGSMSSQLLQLSVCKSWYSLITNPSFITTHLNRTKSSHSHKVLIKFNYENRDCCLSFTDDETFGDEFVKLEYPVQNYNEFKIVGSCDELLCLSNYYGSDYAVLWNPSIRRFMKLPKSGSSVTKAHRLLRFDFGFGFNDMSNDYKVVKIVCAKDKHRRYVVHRVELFALSMGSWRSVCIGDLCYELYGFDSLLVFVNGAAHWVVFNLRKDCVCILAFDIVEEVFREIALPNHQIDMILRTDASITLLGKSFAVILYEVIFTFVKTIGLTMRG